MKAHVRPGFTLIQLLVLLAILGFLLGLLLPALARVRQAAARAQSQNNLKQIAFACHHYNDANGKLPPGNDGNNFSAAAHLLPYIEQVNLYKQINFNQPVDGQANAQARKVRVKVYESPLDPVEVVTEDAAPTNYLFCAGSKYSLTDNNGIFYQNSNSRIPASFPDGTSNTIIVGETLKGTRALPRRPLTVQRHHVGLRAGALKGLTEKSGVQEFKARKNVEGDRCASWMDGRFLQGTFTATRLHNDSRPDVDCDGAGGLSGLRSLLGGVNVAFGDASVRFIRSNLNLDTWQLLANSSDGLPIPNID